MKKSLKKLLLIGSTLGAAGIVAGSVALSSCTANIWRNADGSFTISSEPKPSTNVNSESGNESGTNSVEANKNHKDENHHENKHNDKHDSNVSIQQQTNANLQQLINEHKTNDELIAQAKEHGLNISSELSSEVSVSISKLNIDRAIDDVDPTMGQFVLTINEDPFHPQLGSISFINENGENTKQILAVPGQKIQIKATSSNDNFYTLIDLQVYDATSNNTLGVTKLDKQNIYEFTLPSTTLSNGQPNPFYSTGSIKIVPVFAENQMNDFIYDFNSKAYVLNINTDNYVFDDLGHANLRLIGTETGWAGGTTIQYRIYLNGHNLTIKNLTVPSGAQLMFINNIKNENNGSTIPTVKLSENTFMYPPQTGNQYGQITVKGAIGRYGSVQYGKRMADYFEPHWATDIPEMPKNNIL